MSQNPYRQLNWSPVRAIREYCLWCCADQRKEVSSCEAQGCPLHQFRFGRIRGGDQVCLRAIRRKCLDCVTGSHSEIVKCESRDCVLWHFRLGTYPPCAT
ncbi:MAG TPA: hypothetical protein PK250_11240 [Syntrophobacter fumaroxidans]|nr:hypothetical protein [Syntrophobacter fumaroxidans]